MPSATRHQQLIYLHGFNSSPQSTKAVLTVAFVRANYSHCDCWVPQLPHSPKQAIAMLEARLPMIARPVIVGSSLGGFYANYLAERYNCKAVLVNPAVHPDELLVNYLGPQQNPYTQENYTLTEQHMVELQALKLTAIRAPNNRMLLVQMGDETLDFLQATQFYHRSPCIIERGGDHSFQGYQRWLPAIAEFLALE